MTAPVIMVHGAFCGGWAFDRFRRPFETAGLTCVAPDLRGHAAGEARQAVTGVSMTDYAADIAALAEEQAEPPVLVGHSLGGLVCAMAAARTKVKALVLLAPSPPWGVSGGTIEEAVSAMGLYSLGAYWTQAVDPDPSLAAHYGLDRLADAERATVIERMGPESGRALWETLNWWLDPFMTTQVSADRIAAPTLVVAGGRDVVHPQATVEQTARRLGAKLVVRERMSHWLVGEPGWEDVARTCLAWLEADVRAAA